MSAQQQHFITTAYLTATTLPVSVGTVLCFTNVATNRFIVATTANLATYTQSPSCIALDAGDVNNLAVRVQQVGWLPNSVTGLGPGAAGSICITAAGRLARGSSPSVVGTCDLEGNAMVNFSGVGVGGASGAPVGAQYVTMALDGTLTNERVIAPGTGISIADGGANGNVTISNTGAPVGASYLTLGLDGTLTNERVLTAGTNVTFSDTGANGTLTINASGGSGFTAGGDLSGTSTVQNVIAVHGATIPAAGALVTGNAPYVSGVSALTYSALNLAGGAGWVTNNLPVANIAFGSANQFLRTNAGGTATVWATVTIPTSAGSANQVQTSDGSGGFLAPTNVLASANALSIGTPAGSTGSLRLPNTGNIVYRNAANSADQYLCQLNSSNILAIGSDSLSTISTMVSSLQPAATASINYVINGSFVGTWSSATFEVRPASMLIAGAVMGFAALSAPFQFGRATVSMATPTSGSVVLSAAQYSQPFLTFTGATNSVTVAVVPAAAGTYNAMSAPATNPCKLGAVGQVAGLPTVAVGTALWAQYNGTAIEQR